MVRNKNIHTFCMLIALIGVMSNRLFSQEISDSLKYILPEIVIEEVKSKKIQSSKKIERIDSILLLQNQTNSLATLFSEQTAMHIKSYGNGNIATSSFRGGNASHTAILWNGLNIQNQMLGQNDLSIIAAGLFDEINLEFGGGSALWGSGALGGSIHLNNNTLFNKGYQQKFILQGGSFGTKKIGSSVHYSTKKLSFSNKVYFNSSLNNYTYKDTLDKENINKQITHANYVNKGLLQDLSYQINNNHLVSVKFWYNNSFRNLPNYTSTISKKHQIDENLRLNASYTFTKKKIKSNIKTGYFKDILEYHDSIAKIFSLSKVVSKIIEIDNSFNHKNTSFNFGINYSVYEAFSDNYIDKKSLQKLAFFLANQTSFFNSKLIINSAIRKEFSSIDIPLTGGVGLSYQMHKLLQTKINASKSFRQPSLNDLYYNPGGNPSLKPESSEGIDVGLLFKKQINKLHVSFECTYFNKHTDNWIIWLPSSLNYWTPRNIAQVYSRGTDAKLTAHYKYKHWQIKFIANTAYVLSTNKIATSDNDNSVGRQLIYTPRYSGNGTLNVMYKNTILTINQSYTGYRFTTTDNTSWLSPYALTNIKLAHKLALKQITLEGFVGVNNMFNKNYLVVSQQPMMQRNFEIGLILQYKQLKNK